MSEYEEQEDIGAIWIMKGRNGKEYLSISIEINGKKQSFVAFKNHKSKPQHPDFRVLPSKSKVRTETEHKTSQYRSPDRKDDAFDF